ncbi:hypothetical protein FDZ71_06685, partial [bacterium]
MPRRLILTFTALVFMAACAAKAPEGGAGSGGKTGVAFSLSQTASECLNGGATLAIGPDLDSDGLLDPAEKRNE